MKRILVSLLGVCDYLLCGAQVQLVKDINSGPSSMQQANDYSTRFYKSGNLIYFPVRDVAGNELWKSDGTPQGTNRIVDLSPGSNDGCSYVLGGIQDKLLFAGNNGSSGIELWITDGTANGTNLVKDIAYGAASSFPQNLMHLNNKYYFESTDELSRGSLWQTDGTAEGTIQFYNFGTGSINFFEAVAGSSVFYFVVSTYDKSNNTFNDQLWKSDGTVNGTQMVYDLGGNGISFLTTNGDNLYFTSNSQVWRSDGTAVGTQAIESAYGFAFFPFNSKMLYSAYGSTYITDGTPGSAIALVNKFIYATVVVDNKLYGVTQNSLVVTDGTPAGTTELADLGNVNANGLLALVNNKIMVPYNVGSTDYSTQELGAFDMTTNTLDLVKDINPGTPGSSPRAWITLNNKTFFLADDGINGQKIWVTDGTADGTQLFEDPMPGTGDAYVSAPISVGNRVLFSATRSDYDFGLWQTQGDPSSTALDTAIMGGYVGTLSSEAYYFNNLKIFKVNGSTGENQTLLDMTGQASGWALGNLNTVAGGKLYFSFGTFYSPSAVGDEIYVTDGTPAGTHLVKDINPGAGNGVFWATGAELNSKLVFGANNGVDGTELWITDGSDAGTMMVKDIYPGATGSNTVGFTSLGNYVFFSASDDTHGNEIWKSDGTAAGTSLVKDITPGTSDSFPAKLIVFNNLIYFITTADGVAKNLWKTDGTEAGTILVNTFSSGITYLAKNNDKLFIAADDGIHGQELWISNGTADDMQLVDLNSGALSSNPQDFFSANDLTYFVANGAIWKTQGTAESTIKVSDASPTTQFTSLQGWLYFGANSVNYGNELFKLKIKSSQNISFSDIPIKMFTDVDFALSAASSSGLPLSFETSNSNVALVINGVIHIVGAGTVTITASQDGNDDFENALPVSKTLIVTKAMQAINFPTITGKSLDDKSFTLSADASSGLPVAFFTTSTKVQLTGSSLGLLKPGKVVIKAMQPGNSNYDSAASVTQVFCVNPAKPSITALLDATIEDGLISSSNTGNLWYYGNTLLSDTTKILKPTMSGPYQLQVVIEGCQSTLSDIFDFVVTGLEQEQKISIYPNPTSEAVTIDLSNSLEPTSVQITNIAGVEVARINSTSSKLSVDMSNLSSGFYFVKVTNGGNVVTIKIVKI